MVQREVYLLLSLSFSSSNFNSYLFNTFKRMKGFHVKDPIDLLVEKIDRLEKIILDYQLKEWDAFVQKEFKYPVKLEILNWMILRREKQKKAWSGYDISYHIEAMWDEYTIINFHTGEMKCVKEEFIESLLQTIDKKI